jgi:hypothetical protein
VNHKLRPRPRRTPHFVPVAAEVLELRALLSSAGSAAHAAVNHAAVQTHAIETGAGETHAVAPHGFHISQNAQIQLGGGSPGNVPVKFSISTLKSVVGSKVTAHASGVIITPGQRETIKATFTGTVQSVVPGAGYTNFAITPTGGNIVIKITGGGQKFTATALPNGTLSGASIFGTKFIDFHATDLFTADSVAPFTNQAIKFDIDTL